MSRKRTIYHWLMLALLFCTLQAAGIPMYGQDHPRAASKRQRKTDTLSVASSQMPSDSLQLGIEQAAGTDLADPKDSLSIVADSLAAENKKKMLELTGSPNLQVQTAPTDSLQKDINKKVFIPNPTKATWLALVIPGGGQIYNRKYWKLPIFYGGFAGCAYALTWNNKMYKDYMAAYKDAVNENWTSKNITDLLPANYSYSTTQLTEILRKRKNSYRRYRDMSIFAFIGVYILSVIDAYVDAELSNFDITPDLSMSVEPAVMDNQMSGSSNKAVGVQCNFKF